MTSLLDLLYFSTVLCAMALTLRGLATEALPRGLRLPAARRILRARAARFHETARPFGGQDGARRRLPAIRAFASHRLLRFPAVAATKASAFCLHRLEA